MTDVLSPEFEVTQATLQTMIVGMIDTYNVLNIMRDVGLDPDTIKFAGGGDYAWMRRVGWSPNGVYNLFHGCDSIYHNPSHNQKKHWFYPDNRPRFECLGTEINYYVQGALFRCFDCTYNYAEGIARTWKDVSGHGVLTDNCVYFLAMGYSDLLMLWSQVLATERKHIQDRNILEHRRMRARVAAEQAKAP